MRDTVERMFEAIDASRWELLPGIFSESCIYERPGYPPIHGIEALTRFYSQERRIASGRHVIGGHYECPSGLIVTGSFSGHLRDGQQVSVEFADCYGFADGLIDRRKTYFYAPLI